MHSCLYHGSVRHRRHEPAAHAFRYRLALLYLDLDEMDTVFARTLVLVAGQALGARALAPRGSLRRSATATSRECIRELVRERAGIDADGPVRLLTHPRHFGYGFNPGQLLLLLRCRRSPPLGRSSPRSTTRRGASATATCCRSRPTAARRTSCTSSSARTSTSRRSCPWTWSTTGASRVRTTRSPCTWRTGATAARCSTRHSRCAAQPITGTALAASLARHPLVTFKVTAAIYWQALRLWLKRTPLFTHPDKTGAGHRHRAGRIDPHRDARHEQDRAKRPRPSSRPSMPCRSPACRRRRAARGCSGSASACSCARSRNSSTAS